MAGLDFKKDLQETGDMVCAIGNLIKVASDLEDLSQLPEIRDQLKVADSVLSTILVVDRIQKAQD